MAKTPNDIKLDVRPTEATQTLLGAMREASDWFHLAGIFQEGYNEICRAREKHGKQDDLPDGTGPYVDVIGYLDGPSDEYIGSSETAQQVADVLRHRCDEAHKRGEGSWRNILLEEVFEAMAESDPVALRAELIQVLAMTGSWIQIIDERA